MRHRWFRGALTLGTVLTLAAARVPAQDMSAAIAALRDPNAGRRIDALRQLNMAAHAPAAEYVAPLVTDPRWP
jgi:hypothetical protein